MKLSLSILIGLMFLSLVTGCSAKYQRSALGPTRPPVQLDSSGSVYVSVPEDGRFEAITYPKSGKQTAQALYVAFLDRATNAELGKEQQSCEEGLAHAKSNNMKYFVCPTVTHWEERATEWSGKPDKIQVEVRVTDATSGDELDSVLIVGKSKWATFGGDHPEELLAKPINEYVGSLYGEAPKK